MPLRHCSNHALYAHTRWMTCFYFTLLFVGNSDIAHISICGYAHPCFSLLGLILRLHMYIHICFSCTLLLWFRFYDYIYIYLYMYMLASAHCLHIHVLHVLTAMTLVSYMNMWQFALTWLFRPVTCLWPWCPLFLLLFVDYHEPQLIPSS